MFGWLKEKATKAALSTCRFNIVLTAQTLLSIANDADARIEKTAAVNPYDVKRVRNAQQRLLTDVQIGLANGMTMQQIRNLIVEATIKDHMSIGGCKAIEHVLDTAAGKKP